MRDAMRAWKFLPIETGDLSRASVALAAVLALLTAATAMQGCSWLRYREIARTHAELMSRLAEDARDAYLVEPPRLRASDITRLSYPLERARDFERAVRPRRPDSAVLASLAEMIEDYAVLVDYLDAVRARSPDAASRERVVALTAAVVGDGRRVRRALDDGRE